MHLNNHAFPTTSFLSASQTGNKVTTFDHKAFSRSTSLRVVLLPILFLYSTVLIVTDTGVSFPTNSYDGAGVCTELMEKSSSHLKKKSVIYLSHSILLLICPGESTSPFLPGYTDISFLTLSQSRRSYEGDSTSKSNHQIH